MRIALSLAVLALTSTAVLAADVLYEDTGLRPTIEPQWSGVYVGGGVSIGHIEDTDTSFAPLVPVLHSEGEGAALGVFAGVLFQQGNFVGGFEYEYEAYDLEFEGNGPFPPFIGPLDVFVKNNHSFKARVGYAMGRFLPYVTGGIGYARVEAPTGDLEDTTGILGAGVEYALADNFRVGLEYKHTWFENFDDQPIDGDLDSVSFRGAYQF